MGRVGQELKKIVVAVVAAAVIVFGIMVFLVIWTSRDQLQDELQTVGATATPPTPDHIHAWVVPMPEAGEGLPLVGPEGVDANGFPQQRVDRVGLLAMLLEGDFIALNAAMNEAQARFEEDAHYEDWAVDAVEAFSDADPRVGVALESWPREDAGWARLAAQGAYWRAVGWRQRGEGFVSATSDERLRAFALNLARAVTLFREALAAKPTAIGAATELVRTLGRMGDPGATKDVYRIAIEACPSCTRVRYEYFRACLPRWGGSIAELERIVADARAQATLSSRLANFDAAMSAYRCRLHLERERDPDPSPDCADAARRGFYGYMLAHALDLAIAREEWAQANALANRALTMPGTYTENWVRAIQLSLQGGHAEEAGIRLLTARRLKPTEPRLRHLERPTGDALLARAQELLAAGDRTHARTLFEQATWLDDRVSVESARGEAVSSGLDASPGGLETLRAAHRANPDSFEAAQDLDYALSTHGSWDEILEIWNDYLRRHARDASAYRERSGTLQQMGRPLDALLDLDRACALGLDRSCTTANRVHLEQRDRAALRGE